MASKQEKCSSDCTDSVVPVDRPERESEFQLVQFCTVPRTAQGQGKALSTKKCPKSTPSSSVSTKCVELPHCDPRAPISIRAEGVKGHKINVMKGYNDTSTQGILQAVEIDGKRTLSLDGKFFDDKDHDTVFKEYNQVHRDEQHGFPITSGLGVYLYECCKFPGYYICWHDDKSVDCERRTNGQLDDHYFKWEKKPVPVDETDNDDNGEPQLHYSWLVAHRNPSLVSPACLTFRDDNPIIQTTNPTKFLIYYQPKDNN